MSSDFLLASQKHLSLWQRISGPEILGGKWSSMNNVVVHINRKLFISSFEWSSCELLSTIILRLYLRLNGEAHW